MFPHLHDLFNYLLGTDICFPGQTFGFFVALAFLSAYLMLGYDMRDREKRGEFKLNLVRTQLTGPFPFRDVFVQAGIWGIIGYKLGLGIFNWDQFCTMPHEFLLNLDGSIPIGLGAMLLAGLIRYWQFKKWEPTRPIMREEWLGPSQHLGTFVTIAFVAGILGAKVFHHLEYIGDFISDPMGQLFSASGLTFYGGLITGGFFIGRFIVKKGYNLLHNLDVFGPAMMLSYAVGRIGCQMAGDGDWGIANPASAPDWFFLPEWMWSFDYPGNVAGGTIAGPGEELIPGCIGQYCTHLVPPVWPTPFYETLMCLGIFGLLLLLRSRFNLIGQLTGAYFFLNGLERFFIEKIRVNSFYQIFGFEITQAEIISTILMLAGIAIFVFATRVYKKPIPRMEVSEREARIVS